LNQAEVKKLRTESLLKELIPEALAGLDDERLHELSVIDVVCSKGRSDAKVFLDPTFCEKKEEGAYLSQLRKARVLIENHCKNDQGWFRCPRLTFSFDHQLEQTNKMEALFEKARKDLYKDNDEGEQ